MLWYLLGCFVSLILVWLYYSHEPEEFDWGDAFVAGYFILISWFGVVLGILWRVSMLISEWIERKQQSSR